MGDAGNPAGSAAEHLNEAANKVGENLRDLGGQVREAAREKYEQYSGKAQDFYEHGREAAEGWEKELEAYIQEKPLKALAVAAGVGLILGLLWKRS
jgi:ElaB/YqjD/DUF883 family membrane-anchored ribosome-binding protein